MKKLILITLLLFACNGKTFEQALNESGNESKCIRGVEYYNFSVHGGYVYVPALKENGKPYLCSNLNQFEFEQRNKKEKCDRYDTCCRFPYLDGCTAQPARPKNE